MSRHNDTSGILDHFFRHEYARLISHLVNKYGTQHFDLAEDCVQEALLKAAKLWPFKGIPDNPIGWLTRVSTNALIDRLRKRRSEERRIEKISLENNSVQEMSEVALDGQLNDDLLNMMFACCHPSISKESQIILSLKVLSGFGNAEIARALLKSQDAVAKAYTRAKAKLKEAGIAPNIPFGAELNRRLEVILRVNYLIFNEGYNSTTGESILNQELCFEAMRLTKLLLDHPRLNQPEVNASMALMCFQVSRFDARQDEYGNLLTLEMQDRSKWSRDLIEQGGFYLHKSTRFGSLNTYYLEARIASCHAIAENYEATDWRLILKLYDKLLEMKPNKFTQLNRIVAFSKINGAEKALQLLNKLSKELENHYLFHSVLGSFLQELDKNEQAVMAFKKAISLTENLSEQNYLRNRISVITSI